MKSKTEYIRNFSEIFKSYVTLYKKYLELVDSAELAFLEDFLEPCKEHKYPYETLYEPHIRKAKRQFIECTNTISSLLSELKQNFPELFIQTYNSQHSEYPSIFRRIRKLINNEYSEHIDLIVIPEYRDNQKKRDELSDQFQKLVSNTSDPQEDKKLRKDPKPKKTEICTFHRVMKDFGLPTAHFMTQFIKRPLKYLQQPMLTFPSLKLIWTVCMQKRYYVLIHQIRTASLATYHSLLKKSCTSCRVMKDLGLQLIKLSLKHLQLPSLTFPFLQLTWTVYMQRRYYVLIHQIRTTSLTTYTPVYLRKFGNLGASSL